MKLKLNQKDLMKTEDIKKISKKGLVIKTGRILCIILHEGKGSTWYQLPDDQDRFSINENTYFKVDDGTYLKGTVRFMIFLEGISLPIHHGYIERKQVKKKIKDPDTGSIREFIINVIKGLKFDSKIIDIVLNRHLADEFTHMHVDIPNLILIILLCATLITSILGIVVRFI